MMRPPAVHALFLAFCVSGSFGRGAMADDLADFVEGLTGKSKVDHAGLCQAAGGQWRGYKWSMGGGTSTWEITCAGPRIIKVVCVGYPYTSCSAEDGKDEPPAPPPGDGDDESDDDEHKPPPPPSKPKRCQCRAKYPYCNGDDLRCYKSATSGDTTDRCAGKCTASADGDDEPPHRGGDGLPAAEPTACQGTDTYFSMKEAQEMLDLTNKMRCAVGHAPVTWSGEQQCVAQEVADKCEFSHSDSYSADPPGAENLATGSSVSEAAWMWFTEYTAENPARDYTRVGHFTSMVWKSTTHMGCGICRKGAYDSIIVCHYGNRPGNMMGQFDANVPEFAGHAADYDKCKLSKATAKKKIATYKRWGILKPIPNIVDNLEAKFTVSGSNTSSALRAVASASDASGFAAPASAPWATAAAGVAVLGLLGAVAGLRRGLRRHGAEVEAPALLVESSAEE